jgi:hypothetical protein
MKKISWLILVSMVLSGMPFLAQAAADSAGTNVINNGTVYMVTPGGQLQPYTSAGAFLSYGFNNWSGVVQASTDDLALPTGAFIPPRDGKIVCSNKGSDTGTCYLITDGKKAAFTSATVFRGLGFSFSNTLSGDVSFLTSAPNISSASQAHLPGTLVNENGTIYLVGDNGLLGVPDMNTLNSWGYASSDIVPTNIADSSSAQSGVMAVHTPGALSPLVNTSLSFGTNPSNPTETPTNTAITPTVPAQQPIVTQPAPTPAPQTGNQNTSPVSNETVSQKNAVAKAMDYLNYSAFSHDGLVAQLEYDQFSQADATYGADNSGANWDAEAAAKAKDYMNYSAFSRSGLIAQLEYDKFTQEQAEYGANAVGL